MSDFRFAIMGAGKIARKFCDAVALTEGARVCAVASKSMERARTLCDEKAVPAAYDSYEGMLEAEKPDCVYIAATCDAHFELSMLCAEHGVPVLCEKAMFMSAREADIFFGRAKERGVFAMEALWSRFLPAVNQARSWVKEGQIGEVACAEMNIGFAAPPSPDNRYFNPALGGGASYDLTVYGLQLLTWVLERPIVRAQVEAVAADTGVDATALALLSLGGLPAVVKSSLKAALDDRLVVYGAAGRIVVPHAHYGSEAFLLAPDGTERAHFADRVTRNGFVYEIEEVMRCIRVGALESAVVPQADTRACAAVYDQIRRAIQPHA
ncbi:MAG: Gfo/Idh/MocA family oxidoreductase [Clostridia bacterium]|nr:Gfo/Idh/MocA family oxidoreductase [Clostridia bacterium]